MDNISLEKKFDYQEDGSWNLIYCGLRERCYGHKYAAHKRTDSILTLINEGRAEFWINGQKKILSENYFYVMHSKSEMSYTVEEGTPWSISWIVTKGETIEKILNTMGITRENPYLYIPDPTQLRNIMSEIFEKINRDDLISKMECKALMYRFFAAIAQEVETFSNNPHLDGALKYIHKHFCEAISVQTVAQEINLHPNYFSKLFKKNFGISPVEYINRLRLDKAKFLLKQTDMKISEISEAAGLEDPFYFSRLFKKEEQMSPQQYRTLH